MRTDKQAYLFIFGLLGWLVGQLLWVFVGTQAYYISVALFVTIMVGIIHRNTEENWKKHVSRIAMFICFNNLADEIIFDPTKFSYNEILTALIFAIYTWKKYKKYRNGSN